MIKVLSKVPNDELKRGLGVKYFLTNGKRNSAQTVKSPLLIRESIPI